MTALAVLGWLLLVPVAVPGLVFLVECWLGMAGLQRRGGAAAPVRFAILMPAHDEAATITQILRPLVAGLPPMGRVLVVADNCSDDTAAVARAAGAAVVERHDVARRGKGFALDFGRAALASDPPEVVIVLDADCVIAPADAERLAAAAIARPVQARYLFTNDLAAPAMVQVSNFALLVKNRIRQRGSGRLGAPAILTGTGMAFPWAIFAEAPLATDDLVEDLALGVDLARAGHAPVYRDDIVVTSAASSGRGTLVQRTRWEHGFLATARRHGPGLVREGLRGRSGLAWLGLHLMTPPLALLVMASAAVWLIEAALFLLSRGIAPLMAATALLLAIVVTVLTAWALHGRDTLAAGTLLRLPLYLAWKLPIYLGLARSRETKWVRSERVSPVEPPLH